MTNTTNFNPDGQEVLITHPDKILVKNGGYTKIDFVSYYNKVGRTILKYGKGRPLSVLRYPHGYPGNSFFQRNKSKGAPAWVKSKLLGVHQKADYVLLNNIATLLWLVNLGSLEIHAAQVSERNFSQPDMLVFDLDPPPNTKFSLIRDFAISIKPMIESFGYNTFVKTSGKSGIHIYCPIKPKWSFDEVFEAAKEVGEEITKTFSESTLKISKKERVNKILVDIYRNHSYQSMVIPFGIRATPAASVSLPLSWENLKGLTTPNKFTIKTVNTWMTEHENPWQKMKNKLTVIHTQK